MFGHDKRSLAQLFDTPIEGKNSSYFQVPRYQRKYEWEKERQVSKLIDDVFENLGRTYFMGPLILCSGSSPSSSIKQNSVELIDGQQRLATLAIFIRAVIDYIQCRKSDSSFPDNLDEKVGDLKFELKSKIIKGGLVKNEVVIHLPQRINQFFRDEIILDDKGKVEKLQAKKKGQHPSIKRLIDAYAKIWESLEGRYSSKTGEPLLAELFDLASSIINEKIFLVITVPDHSDAYTIFETINDRGKRLTLSDLVKNLCFQKMDVLGLDTLQDFENDWDEAEVSVSDFASFLWHAWVSRHETCPRKDVFSKLQEGTKEMTAGQVFDLATDLILNEVKYYHNYENPGDVYHEEKRRYLEMLKAMDATRCYPLLLSIDCAEQAKNITAKEATELLKVVTCLTFWHSGVCNSDAKKLEETYHTLARKTREITKESSKATVEEIRQALAEGFPSMATCEAHFTTRGFTDNSFIKMVLQQIELTEYQTAETTLKGPKLVQLEHILPKNPVESWKEVFPNVHDMTEYSQRFGNYTLILDELNKEARNKSFSVKKASYEKSKIGLTKALASTKKWNAKAIDRRSKRLFELAKKVWPIYYPQS